MKFVSSFIKKPRNVYFSIIFMLTLVAGLASVSFSYYIDESSTDGVLKYEKIDNRIQSDDLVGNLVSLAAHETKEINLYVMSNNSFDSNFKLFYKTNDNVKVLSSEVIKDFIGAKEVQQYTLLLSNFGDDVASLELDIASARIDSEVIYDGIQVELSE